MKFFYLLKMVRKLYENLNKGYAMWFSILILNMILVILGTLSVSKSISSNSKREYISYVEERESGFLGIEEFKIGYYTYPDPYDIRIENYDPNKNKMTVRIIRHFESATRIELFVYDSENAYINVVNRSLSGYFCRFKIIDGNVVIFERGLYGKTVLF